MTFARNDATNSLGYFQRALNMKQESKNLRDFVISLDTNKKKVDEIHYDQKNDQLNIYITPTDQNLTLDDFEFSSTPDSSAESIEKTLPAAGKVELSGGPEKNLKLIGLLLGRLTRNAGRKIYLTYLKEDELKN